MSEHHDPDRPTVEQDPRWVRPVLALLLVATAAFWTVGLSRNGWANSFYSAAVQAGSQSWKAFLFGSSDAANSITVDKPPASLWPMEIAARIFGVNSWSVQLPQVLLGVASVALLYVIVKRRFGPAAALLAGTVLSLTPVATLMFRYNNPDALLVFLMVAAVWALLRGVEDGRTRWLLLCGALVGLGFLTKQLQVMLVVPGLALTYLVAGPVSIGRRIAQLVGALGAVVLGKGGPASGGGFGPLGGNTGVGRLFSGESGGQISWLLPAALIFLLVGIVLCGRVSRTDPRRAQYLVWGGWLLVTAAVFSFMSGIFHDYYTVALAPAVAALTGIGAAHLWSRRQSRTVALTLSATMAVTAIWAWVLLGRSPDFLPALRWVILGGGVLAAVALPVATGFGSRTPSGWHVTGFVAALALATAIAAPLAYCIQTVSTAHTSGIVVAGPTVKGATIGPPGMSAVQSGEGAPASGDEGPPRGGGPGLDDTTISGQVTAMLSSGSGEYTWVAAVDGAITAAHYQLATDDPVMPIGGFSTGDPSPTVEQFQAYVSAHRIHYYVVENKGPMGMGSGAKGQSTEQNSSEAGKIAAWVKEHYRPSTIAGVDFYDLSVTAG